MGPRRLSIELPEEAAEIIDARLAAGRNASESEVVQEALELLAEQDAPLEEWLRTEMVEAYDEWKANPEGGLTIDEVRDHLRKAREERQARA